MLVFLDVYPTVQEAEDRLKPLVLPDTAAEENALEPVGGPRGWIEVVIQVLTLAGFIEPSSGKPKSRPMRALSAVIAFGLWALTWIVPVTFMLAMAWNCEGRTRKVFDRALGYYGDVEADKAEWRRSSSRWRREQPLRAVLLGITILIPIGLAGYVAEAESSGWLKVAVGFVALATALALAAKASRR